MSAIIETRQLTKSYGSQLALAAHLGQPMIGEWDPAGVLACVVAAGGILLGAWG